MKTTEKLYIAIREAKRNGKWAETVTSQKQKKVICAEVCFGDGRG